MKKLFLITIITERVMTANGYASFLIFNNLWSESFFFVNYLSILS